MKWDKNKLEKYLNDPKFNIISTLRNKFVE